MRAKASNNKQQEVQRIIDTLTKGIAQHRLKPGQRLVEAQIVDALKVNRNHVQSALQRLALLKIITIEPNRGAIVSQPTAQEARDVFAARRAIERGIVESITPAIYENNQQRIEQHMVSEREAIKGVDRREIVGKLSDYHRLLADVCDNLVLKEIFENLMVRSSLIVALYQRNDIPSCASDEHQQILDSLKEGDTDKAVAIMLEHLDELESQLVLDDNDDKEVDLFDALTGL